MVDPTGWAVGACCLKTCMWLRERASAKCYTSLVYGMLLGGFPNVPGKNAGT